MPSVMRNSLLLPAFSTRMLADAAAAAGAALPLAGVVALPPAGVVALPA